MFFLRAWMWLVPIAMMVAAAAFGAIAAMDERWGLLAVMVFMGLTGLALLALHWWLLYRFAKVERNKMTELREMTKEERLERTRHSAAHIMAEVVLEMFPEAKLGIGPPIDTGFYYDFELPRPLSTEDLPVIEEKMRARIESDVPFEPSAIPEDE